MTKTIEVFRRRERERRKLKMRWSLWTKLENGKLSYAWYAKLSKKGEPLGLGRWNRNIEFVIIWSSFSTSKVKTHTKSIKGATKTVTFVWFCFVLFPAQFSCIVLCTYCFCYLEYLSSYSLMKHPFNLSEEVQTIIQGSPRRVWEFPENISVKW